ncbi:hypothetical protein TWF481_006075 [Arthrobotrys musiformis]|uniref:Fucose-specific lectin n=1 Tax=Arthrobotrys musiformis TaxID=47236 RepID=A0AAV9WG79_9PEZI
MSCESNTNCRCHTPKQARVAISGILNNQDNEGLEILQFYTSKHQNLKLVVRKNGGNESSPAAAERISAPKEGPIALDSPLVTLQFNHQTRVYAVSTIPGPEGNLICSVSPSFEVVGNDDRHASTKYRVLAGTGNGVDKGWLYELEDSEDGKLIREHDVGSGENQEFRSIDIGKDSQLAAFYDNYQDNNSRYVVFSEQKGKICYKDVGIEAGEDYTLSAVTALGRKPAPGTSLAACALGEKFFIFYLSTSGVAGDNNYYLFHATGNVKSASASCSKVENAKALPGGHLSVVPVNASSSARKGRFWDIIIFYLKQGEPGRANVIAKAKLETNIPYEPKA